MLVPIEVEPLLHKTHQVLNSSSGGSSEAFATSGAVTCVGSKQLNFKTCYVQQPEGQREIGAQAIMFYFGREAGEFSERVEIERLRFDAGISQALRLTLPARDQRRTIERGCDHCMDLTGFHESPSA